jgi:hypothetical protein
MNTCGDALAPCTATCGSIGGEPPPDLGASPDISCPQPPDCLREDAPGGILAATCGLAAAFLRLGALVSRSGHVGNGRFAEYISSPRPTGVGRGADARQRAPAVYEQGTSSTLRCVRHAIARSKCPKFETGQFRKLSEALVPNGGRYWDRTSGPCRVKRVYGAYGSTICERRPQLQQALDIT